MKDDIKRAIRHFEIKIDKLEDAQKTLHANEGDYAKICKTALRSLKTEFNKMDGCKHCTGVIVGFYEVDATCCLTICDINANFCPNCGRKLRGGEDE